MNQVERMFFDIDGSYPDLPERPSKDDLLSIVEDPNFPLNRKFIVSKKNEGAVHTVKLKILQALSRYNHSLGCSIIGENGYSTNSCALVGESSVGKTHLAKLIAECISITFIEIQPKSVSDTQDIFNEIYKGFAEDGIELVDDNGKFFLPPCIVFIDEVHELSGKLKNAEGLLNAIEPSDAILKTKDGLVIDCFNVCWIVATTEVGKLFHALKTRMDIIELYPPGFDEIAKIVQLDNPDWDKSLCELVAKFCRVPREAKRFADKLRAQKAFYYGSWEDSAIKIAKSKGIDEEGMHYKEIALLNAIKNGPVGKKNLPSLLQCQTEEVENDILPPLMRQYNDRPPLIKMTRKGVTITESGKKELEKRGVAV